MASPRYTWNIDPKELKPDEPPHPMTAREKRENFWFYYKWHIIIGIVVCCLAGSFIWELVTQVHPDYTIGLLSTGGTPAGLDTVLSEQLTQYFDDRNGDGEVVVDVMDYTIGKSEAEIADANMQIANVTKLSGDISTGQSMLFLVSEQDLAFFEEQYGFFAYNDGTTPAEGETIDYARMGVRWADCPALTSLELGTSTNLDGSAGEDYQTFLQDYKLVTRVYADSAIERDKEATEYYNCSMAVFQTLTQP